MSFTRIALLFVLIVGRLNVAAQERPLPPAPPTVREITPGVFQIGTVRLEKTTRTLTFPATLNMNEGLVEYLLVTTMGKTHESLLKTTTQPQHIHVAMLLLGAKGAHAKPLTNAPAGGSITAEQLAQYRDQPLAGEAVTLEVRWKNGTETKRVRLEEWLLNRKAKAPMTRGEFTFNGSQLWQGHYLAQQEGSIISIITDPAAVFNNPRPGRDADDNWEIIRKDLPPLDTPVEVIIQLLEKSAKP